MTRLLKIEESRTVDSQGKKMLHRAVDGRLFIGPPIHVGCYDKVIVEASPYREPDGYYHISRVLRVVPERRNIV
jgi:hypothetical protein